MCTVLEVGCKVGVLVVTYIYVCWWYDLVVTCMCGMIDSTWM